MSNKNKARQCIAKLKTIREGRVTLHKSVAGYKKNKFFLFAFVPDELRYHMIIGTSTKISIQYINTVCSADDDYMFTQICMQMAKREYQYLNGLGCAKWPTIYI